MGGAKQREKMFSNQYGYDSVSLIGEVIGRVVAVLGRWECCRPGDFRAKALLGGADADNGDVFGRRSPPLRRCCGFHLPSHEFLCLRVKTQIFVDRATATLRRRIPPWWRCFGAQFYFGVLVLLHARGHFVLVESNF